MMIPNGLIFPIDSFVWIIESVMPTHLKHRQVTPECRTNIIDVNQSNTRLSNHQWVGRRGNNSIRNIGLKIDNAGAGKIKVVSPPRNNRVGSCSFMTMFLKKREKSLPHFTKTKASGGWWMIDERQRRTALRSCFPTSLLVRILGPKIYFANWT